MVSCYIKFTKCDIEKVNRIQKIQRTPILRIADRVIDRGNNANTLCSSIGNTVITLNKVYIDEDKIINKGGYSRNIFSNQKNLRFVGKDREKVKSKEIDQIM